MNLPRREQFTGCLIGPCLGDALGCRVEGYPPEDPNDRVTWGYRELVELALQCYQLKVPR
jgi:ADP-ribosylglycohydrolase